MKFSQALLTLFSATVVTATASASHSSSCDDLNYRYADDGDLDDITVIKARSKKPNHLKKKFAAFQSLLGDVNNNSGPATAKNGFRSINWDAPIVPFEMPGDFFATTVDRGLTVSSKYNSFRVSNPSGDDYTVYDDKFSSINEIASEEFSTFSPDRLFTPVAKDNEIVITFTVPGTSDHVPAVVNGFGAIFVDVDQKDTTKMTLYDKYGCELYEAYAEPKDEGLSFVGVSFGEGNDVVAKVVLTLGNAAIDSWVPCEKRRAREDISSGNHPEEAENNLRGLRKKNSCPFDVVVLDDFTYGEPYEMYL